MNNALRQLESEYGVIYVDQTYSIETLNKCKKMFKTMREDGIFVDCEFSDNKWLGYSDLKHIGISFDVDENKYYAHAGKELGTSYQTIINMLKSYTIYVCGVYIFQSIAKRKVNVIKDFLQNFKEKKYKETTFNVSTIKEFLEFIGVSEKQINHIDNLIKSATEVECETNRKLKPFINYLVVADMVNKLYQLKDLDDETFCKWFPVFFWVNISFIIPIRVTELLVTPLNCIDREGDKVVLKIRRTILKKGRRTVYYDVNKDYKIFPYSCFDGWTLSIIEKYIHLTSNHKRRFLIEPSKNATHDMLSPRSLNLLIKQFMDKYVIGNKRYDFVLYASKIKEFSYVLAGDSRPIAIGNLYFQGFGEDVIKELADHERLSTTEGYYEAVADIIRDSSMIRYLDKLELQTRMRNDAYYFSKENMLDLDTSICTSPEIAMNNKNLKECLAQHHLDDHMGCPYYRPSRKELDDYLVESKKKVIENTKELFDCLDSIGKFKNVDIPLEEIILKIQTYASRYNVGCNLNVEEMGKEWLKLKNTQKTCC